MTTQGMYMEVAVTKPQTPGDESGIYFQMGDDRYLLGIDAAARLKQALEDDVAQLGPSVGGQGIVNLGTAVAAVREDMRKVEHRDRTDCAGQA